ncbi:unknown [Sulfolobus spindle-shaped virus 6]|uniref:Uncharacterized protein n=1 Tax=Sulfolobus spindle-shaped virus 6 TaxID=693627 RepID=D1GF45_9VIRU|nr:hypothetical protein SSSV6_gp27 [Sulfolobus spindle-shaped virus 6]ACZ35746.1 unknown [Sulfolobus spindle-shaped virus 6]
MKWPLLLVLVIPLLAVSSLASTQNSIQIISTPPVNPPAYSYFYLEFQFSPTNNTPQPYAIFVGPSVNNLTEVAEGYTYPNGTGYARVPVINSQIEYIDVVWVNVNYTLIQIFPQTVNTTNTTTTVNIENNQGFTFSLPSWVSWVLGSVIVLIFMGIGWKFMGPAGLAVFGVVSVFLASFFGLIPSYIIYIFVFIVAVIGARVITRQFGGGEEE